MRKNITRQHGLVSYPADQEPTGHLAMEATRRPSAFPTASELSLSQTDEIRLRRKDSRAAGGRRPVEKLPEAERRRRVWIMYFIGFMVSAALGPV